MASQLEDASSTEERRDKTWKYIAAWVLSGWLRRILSMVGDSTIDYANTRLIGFDTQFILGIADGIYFLIPAIIVYGIFRSLYVDRVIPWLIVAGIISFIVNIALIATKVYGDIVFPYTYFLVSAASFGLAIMIFYQLFKYFGRVSPGRRSARYAAQEAGRIVHPLASPRPDLVRSPQETQGIRNAQEQLSHSPKRSDRNESLERKASDRYPAGWSSILKYRPDVAPLVEEVRKYGAELEFALEVESLDYGSPSLERLTALKDSIISRAKSTVYPFSKYELNDWHRILWARHPAGAAKLREIVRLAGEDLDLDAVIIDVVQFVNISIRRLRERAMDKLTDDFRVVIYWTKSRNSDSSNERVRRALSRLAKLSGFVKSGYALGQLFQTLDESYTRRVVFQSVARRLLLDSIVGPSDFSTLYVEALGRRSAIAK